MEFLARHGVTHFDATVDGYDAASLKRHRGQAAEHGVELEMVHIPIQASIGLAASERDQATDNVCEWIGNAAEAGLRGLNYNFCILEADDAGGLVPRATHRPGRGGSTYSSFVFAACRTEWVCDGR